MSNKPARNRRHKSAPTTRRAPGAPAFTYTSDCCKEPATKEPTSRSDEDREAGEWGKASLGSWTCSRCRRKCKVTRTRNGQQVAQDSPELSAISPVTESA